MMRRAYVLTRAKRTQYINGETVKGTDTNTHAHTRRERKLQRQQRQQQCVYPYKQYYSADALLLLYYCDAAVDFSL